MSHCCNQVKSGPIHHSQHYPASFSSAGYCPATDDKLTPADPHDIADSVAFALLFTGKKRIHDSDRMMASIVAERIVTHLDRWGYVVLKKPPIGGSALSIRRPAGHILSGRPEQCRAPSSSSGRACNPL